MRAYDATVPHAMCSFHSLKYKNDFKVKNLSRVVEHFLHNLHL